MYSRVAFGSTNRKLPFLLLNERGDPEAGVTGLSVSYMHESQSSFAPVGTPNIVDNGSGRYTLLLNDADYTNQLESGQQESWVRFNITKVGYSNIDVVIPLYQPDSGGGPHTVTITVDDGTTALQNAKVSLSEGANIFTGTTDVSGQCTFNLVDATYTVAIAKDGYTYAGTSLVVDGDENETYSMTAITIPPATDPDTTTAYGVVRDVNNAIASGVNISARMVKPPASSTGDLFDGTWKTEASAVGTGRVEFNMVKGATYELRVAGYQPCGTFEIPSGAGSTYALPDFVTER